MRRFFAVRRELAGRLKADDVPRGGEERTGLEFAVLNWQSPGMGELLRLVTRMDDAGLCESVNEAVLDAAESGLPKNVSIMVPERQKGSGL